MYDSIPLWFAIPLFILLIMALAWVKWRDYKRLQSEAPRFNLISLPDRYISPDDTPIYDLLAAEKLSWENIQGIEGYKK